MKHEIWEQPCLPEPSGGHRGTDAVSPPVAVLGSRSWAPRVAACKPLASVQRERDPAAGGGCERGAQDRPRPRGRTPGSPFRGHGRGPAPQLRLSVRPQSCCRGAPRTPRGRTGRFRAGEDGPGKARLGRWLRLLLE